jgi:hypothetical protein
MSTISFDTPKTATTYDVQVTGTVPAHASGYVKVTLNVTSTAATPRADSFYREIDIANATGTASAFHGTYALAIVPQLYGSDTVQTTISYALQ